MQGLLRHHELKRCRAWPSACIPWLDSALLRHPVRRIYSAMAETTPTTKVRASKKGQLPPAAVDVPALQPKALKIAEKLQGLYPNPPIPLDHGSSFQLLVAVMLSAQSTDKKVNEITPTLFNLAPDAPSMAALDVGVIQSTIKAIGLAPTKAKNLLAMSQLLVEQHGGQVPGSFEELEALPGVGHKTASVVMTQAFGLPAFPVDTHIHRLAERWGLSSGKNVEQTEADLKALYKPELWHDLHLQIIYFGREHCSAKGHDPSACCICSWAAVPGGQRSTGAATKVKLAKEPAAPRNPTPSKKQARGRGAATAAAAASTQGAEGPGALATAEVPLAAGAAVGQVGEAETAASAAAGVTAVGTADGTAAAAAVVGGSTPRGTRRRGVAAGSSSQDTKRRKPLV